MVEIQCPHCEEDIELEDGTFGLFDCPHCDEDFSWGSDNDLGMESNSKLKDFLSSGIGFSISFLAIFACAIGAVWWTSSQTTTGVMAAYAFIIFGAPIASIALIIYVVLWIIEKSNPVSKQ